MRPSQASRIRSLDYAVSQLPLSPKHRLGWVLCSLLPGPSPHAIGCCAWQRRTWAWPASETRPRAPSFLPAKPGTCRVNQGLSYMYFSLPWGTFKRKASTFISREQQLHRLWAAAAPCSDAPVQFLITEDETWTAKGKSPVSYKVSNPVSGQFQFWMTQDSIFSHPIS